MVLPGVSVRRMLPATGPGGQLDARQQETQAQRNAHLSDGGTAATWRPHGNFKREFLLFKVGTKEINSPSPMTHFLKASSTMSPDPGLESHTKSTKSLY